MNFFTPFLTDTDYKIILIMHATPAERLKFDNQNSVLQGNPEKFSQENCLEKCFFLERFRMVKDASFSCVYKN